MYEYSAVALYDGGVIVRDTEMYLWRESVKRTLSTETRRRSWLIELNI